MPFAISLAADADAARKTASALIKHSRSQGYQRTEIMGPRMATLALNLVSLSGIFVRFDTSDRDWSFRILLHIARRWKRMEDCRCRSSRFPRDKRVNAAQQTNGSITDMSTEKSGSESDDLQEYLQRELGLLAIDVIVCDLVRRIVILVNGSGQLQIKRRLAESGISRRVSGWNVVTLSQAELETQIQDAFERLTLLLDVSEDLANALVGEGVFSYIDLIRLGPERISGKFGLDQFVALRIFEDAKRLDRA